MTEINSGAYVGLDDRNESFSFTSSVSLNVNGGDGNDVIVAGGEMGREDYLIGGRGRDYLYGGGGEDVLLGDRSWNDETLAVGEAVSVGADILFGAEGDDIINGGGGANLINGGADDDQIFGGSGAEHLEGGTGDDEIRAGGGADRLYGGSSSYEIAYDFIETYVGPITTNFDGRSDASATSYLDRLYVSEQDRALTGTGADYLDGGAGDDIIDGMDGADIMLGGEGNDRYYVDSALDVIREYAGEGTADYVFASASYTLKARVEVERLLTTNANGTTAINLAGNEFAQQIFGNAANNKISGFAGNDRLTGNAGADTLYGGQGIDTLIGGAGSDAFMFDAAPNTGVDVILDFSNVGGDNDSIRLDDAVFTGLGAVGLLAPGAFRSNSTGLAQDGDDRIIFNTSNGRLYYDGNGGLAGGSQHIATITLVGATTLTATDIFVF